MQERIADQRWKDAELVAYFVNEGLATSARLREESIEDFGAAFVEHMSLAQVWAQLFG